MSEEVKRRKFLNHRPQSMETSLIPQIKEDWTYEHLVEQEESDKALKRCIAVPTPTTCTLCQTSTKPLNSDYNRLRKLQQHSKTSFNHGCNNLSNWLAKRIPSNNYNWDLITRNLAQKTKMELILHKKRL